MDLSQVSALPDEKKILLIKSILYSAMKMHEQKIVHADIKPTNILLKKRLTGFIREK